MEHLRKRNKPNHLKLINFYDHYVVFFVSQQWPKVKIHSLTHKESIPSHMSVVTEMSTCF